MKNKGWLNVLNLVVLALALSLIVQVSAQSSDNVSLIVDNNQYLDVPVNVSVNPVELSNRDLTSFFDMWIQIGNDKYRYFGDLIFPLSFQVNRLGSYTLFLTNKGSVDPISSTNFEVLQQQTVEQKGFCDDINLRFDKLIFSVDENVEFFIEPYSKNISGVYIEFNNNKYNFIGSSTAAFLPSSPGKYVVSVECLDGSVLKEEFEVVDKINYQIQEVYEGPIASQGFNVVNPFGTLSQRAATIIQSRRGEIVELTKPIPSINKIEFRGLNDVLPNIGLDEISSPIPVNNIPGVRSYAIDPSNMDFNDATVTATAQGNTLFMCKDYDFETRECWGSWQRVRDLIPGEEYSFLITPEDPLFTETNTSPDCSCADSVTGSAGETLSCDTFCEFTIDVPENATSFFLEEISYNMTLTITTSAGVVGPSGSQAGYFDRDTTTSNGNEVLVGSSTASATSSFTWTNSTVPSSGSNSFTDLNCDNWPSHCVYYVYINSSYSFGTPGNSRRDVTMNLTVDGVEYTLNYTVPGPFSIALESPENNFYSNNFLNAFEYIPTNQDNSIDNCSVYTSETSWSAKNTSTSITNGSVNSLDVTFSSDGSYAWNVECEDVSDTVFAPTNRTIIIDTTAPSVTLNSPADSTTITGSNVIGFEYTPTDNNPIDYCTLSIDGVGVSNQTSPSNNSVNTINHNLQNGDYNWSVSCIDVAGNTGFSANRSITVDVPAVILDGLWYETATADCSSPPCDISLAQNIDGTQNDISGSVASSQTLTVVRALSSFMGINGVDIADTSTTTFSTYYTAVSGGNLQARWYIYYRDTDDSDTLICSNTGGTGVSGAAASTGTCTVPSDFYLESTDRLYYRIDMTNTHPSQTRTFNHAVDHLSSFIDIDGFTQIGFLSTNLTSPSSTSYGQSQQFNVTCEIECEQASCLAVDVAIQTNQSGSWANVGGSGSIQLDTGQSNPIVYGNLVNATDEVIFNLVTDIPGTSSLRCLADSKNQEEFSNTIDITVGVSTEPEITLNSPLNNSWVNNEPIIFSYTPTTFGSLDFCELYIDEVLNQTNSSPTPNVANTFSVSNLLETNYNWSVSCTDTGSLVGNSSTYYFEVDRQSPYNLTIFTPLNNSIVYSSIVDFNFTVIDERSSNMSCELYVEGLLNQTVIAQNNTETLFSSSGFDLGEYEWYLSCEDFAGNTNTSGVYNLSIADIPPTIELVTPQNNTGINTSLATLTYTPFDGFGINQCNLYVNGTLNQTDTSITPNQNNTFNITISEQPYTWLVECIDSNSNSANSSEFLFYGDFTPPTITLDSPANLSYFELSTVDFAYTPFDNWPDLQCTINIDSTPNITSSATSGVQTNEQISGFLDGEHDWDVSCLDIALNQNISETRQFTINETPTIILGNPVNNSYLATQDPNLFYTPTDNDGFSECELYLNGVFNQQNATSITSGMEQNFSLTSLAEGFYDWSVSCIDSGIYSNQQTTQNKTFVIDVTPPSINLIDPTQDQELNTTNYVFEWIATDNFASNMSCDLFLDESLYQANITSTNNSITSFNVTGFVTSDYNFSVECSDFAGNQNASETRNFSVIVPPEVTLVSPANDSGDLFSTVTFSYIPSGGTGNFNQCSLYLNSVLNQTNTSITGSAENNFTVSGLDDGAYEWNVLCEDTNNLTGQAPQDFIYYVDTEEPYLIELYDPLNDTIVGVNNVTFNFAAFDYVSPQLSCDIYLTEDGSAPFTIATSLEVDNATNTSFNYVTGDGNYSWYVDCTDKAGLFNISDEFFFEVIAPPNVTLMSPANDTWFDQTSVNLTYLPQDDIQITSCDLYINGEFNQSAGIVINNQNNTFNLNNLAQAQYNWTVQCTDSDSNTFMPQNDTFYVDTDVPLISLFNPVDTEVLTSSLVSFNFSATDNLAPTLSCDLYINDTVNTSSISVFNAQAHIENISGFDDGLFNWSVQCLDIAGNQNISVTNTFEVQEAPTVLLGSPSNNLRTNITDISLFYTPFDNSLQINECTLLLNGFENESSSSITHGVEQNLTVNNLDNGIYLWDVQCEDSSANLGVNGTNKTFYIDLEPPIIELLSPTFNQTFNQNDIDFTWNATDFNDSIEISCDLYITDPLGDRTINNITGLSGTTFNHTEVALEDGEHFWNVTCRDDLNNQNTSETRRFIINQPDLYLDDTRLAFNNPNPDLNETLNITANVSNLGGVNAINALVEFWLGNPDVDGVLIGSQIQNVSQNSSVIYSTTWQIPEGFHTIYVLADPNNDIGELDETNNNATINISVLSSQIISPLNESIFNVDEVEFEFIGRDYTLGSLDYTFFVDGIQNNTGTVTDNQTSFVNLTLAEGVKTIILQMEDSLGRLKNSTPIQLTIDLTPPTPTILTANNTWFNTSNPQINITLTDNLASVINYTLYVNSSVGATGNLSNNTQDLVSLFGLSEGPYELILEGVDIAGNIANSTPIIIYIDEQIPTITLNAPDNNTNFSIRDVQINYTAFDNLAPELTCEINVEGTSYGPFTVNESEPQSFLIENLDEGEYNWNVTCGDLAGNQNVSETRIFNVFIPPEITLLSPLDNAWSDNSTNTFEYNVSDDTGIDECRLYLDNTLNQTDTSVTNNQVNSFTVLNMQGIYEWRVECTDNTSQNVLGVSENRTLNVDLDAPTPVFITDNNTWFNSNPEIFFNITDDLANTINYTIYLNQTQNVSGQVTNNTASSATILGLTNNYYELILEATDLAGNTQNSTPIYIYVDTVAPNITLNSPDDNANITDVNVNLSFTPYDNLAQYLMCDVTLNSVVVASNLNVSNGVEEIVELQNLSGGTYNWNVTCTDQASNTNTSETRTFSIPIPDLAVNASEIYFSNEEPTEGETVNITATIRNIGQGDASNFTAQFWSGSIGTGTQIGSDIIISNLLINESINVSVNYTAPIGENEIFIIVDPDNDILEESILNNNASRLLNVQFWHFALGTTNDTLRITDASFGLLFDWGVSNSSGSNIFVTDFEADLNWNQVQALGRDTSNSSSSSDFEVLDSSLGSTGYPDSINTTYTSGGVPVQTTSFEFFGQTIENVPVVNSTNNSNFITGILWDTGDGGTNYNGTQEIVFITVINKNTEGYDGTYDFEIRIPATLREYRTVDTEKVVFYTEIK